MSAPELVLDGVSARIGALEILHDISFECPTNEVTAILGRNGVGKTTILRSILGFTRRTGDIAHRGDSLNGLAPHRLAGRGIGYVPEDRNVFQELTVAENLRLAERPGSKPDYDLVYDLFPELSQRLAQAAGSLSGGQQQMVSLARALLNSNTLLLIDEPTKGLAPKVVGEVVAVLERIKPLATILMVEQNINVARRLADHVVVVANGRIASRTTASDAFAEDSFLRDALSVSRSGSQDHT